MYALNIDKVTGRVLSATYKKYAAPDSLIVEELPKGNLADYRCIDGVYIYDPLLQPEIPEPEPTTDERIAVLEEELKATKILLGLEV